MADPHSHSFCRELIVELYENSGLGRVWADGVQIPRVTRLAFESDSCGQRTVEIEQAPLRLCPEITTYKIIQKGDTDDR